MAHTKPVIIKTDAGWLLRLEYTNGRHQEYRCASENQARQLAAMFNGASETEKTPTSPITLN
jgi:hypothetical protein